MIQLELNGQTVQTDAPPYTPLLWVLRDHLKLTGTKFGCGMAQCGACTVHLDGQATRSCVLPLAAVAGKRITTIEQVGEEPVGRAVQEAWIAEDVPQCGYCQSGQVMSATALLEKNPRPSEHDVKVALQGNICRCTGYWNIIEAVVAVGEGGTR